jgi:hypothetical protein
MVVVVVRGRMHWAVAVRSLEVVMFMVIFVI